MGGEGLSLQEGAWCILNEFFMTRLPQNQYPPKCCHTGHCYHLGMCPLRPAPPWAQGGAGVMQEMQSMATWVYSHDSIPSCSPDMQRRILQWRCDSVGRGEAMWVLGLNSALRVRDPVAVLDVSREQALSQGKQSSGSTSLGHAAPAALNPMTGPAMSRST